MLHKKRIHVKLRGTKKRIRSQATSKIKTARFPAASEKAGKLKKATNKTRKKAPIPWVPFIHETIKQQNKLLTTRELLNFASKKFNIPDKKKGLKNIKMLLSRMKKRGQLVSHKKRGDKRNYFGLPSSKRNTKKR